MHPQPLQILISPLDWGLGHAARCIPVIRELIIAGHHVTIAGEGRSLVLLQKEFPSLESIEMKSFSPSYGRSGNLAVHLFFLLPKFILSIFSEYFQLRRLIAKNKFDIIISDNKYGLWNKNIKSILITHQVMIKTPAWLRFAEYPLYLVSKMLINHFDECWIPDSAVAPGLSGDLSHKYPLPADAKFIGPLSRFEPSDNKNEIQTTVSREVAVIISGPEPQRSIFEDLITTQLLELNLPATIISGKPEKEQVIEVKGNLKIISHASAEEIRSIIESSALVICRSGYSSAMDLAAMASNALFVPTPGQTEQIYLANLYYNTGKTFFTTQDTLNLKYDIEKALVYPGFRSSRFVSDLSSFIADIKKK